jgi:glycosyltransferase involved in cell wall biosynthesis
MQSAGKRKICALLLGLSGEVGHVYHYHIATQKSVKSLGWEYEAFIPKKFRINVLPDKWFPVLAADYWDIPKTAFFRLKMLFSNILPLRAIFKKEEKNEEGVIFLEHFELQHLASLFFSLWFLKPCFQFWILHRYAHGRAHVKTHLYRAFHWFLERKLGKERLRILTDSELLAELQRDHFSRLINVVPIPHTSIGEKIKKKGPLLLWWPGGSMQEEKGLLFIQKLAQNLPQTGDFRLILAEKGRNFFPASSSLLFIPTALSSEEYIKWMRTADLVLLPYSSTDYAHRTSGIFVEAICLGSIPVVSKGTWMAYELGKYGLFELVLTQDQLVSPDYLATLGTHPKLSEKLDRMRAKYRQFHSEKGFAAALRRLERS